MDLQTPPMEAAALQQWRRPPQLWQLTMSQVAGSPQGDAAKSPGRCRGSGLTAELLRPLINFDRLTIPKKTG